MSTLFESVNKHNRHAFRNCEEFIFDITWYSINFRKLVFVGTLLDETDKWIGYIGIFITSCCRREVKIRRYFIGYMRMRGVFRNELFYEWLVSTSVISTLVDIWLVLRAGSLLFCLEGVYLYFRLCCFPIDLYVKTSNCTFLKCI
jgi:hypothetical protein